MTPVTPSAPMTPVTPSAPMTPVTPSAPATPLPSLTSSAPGPMTPATPLPSLTSSAPGPMTPATPFVPMTPATSSTPMRLVTLFPPATSSTPMRLVTLFPPMTKATSSTLMRPANPFTPMTPATPFAPMTLATSSAPMTLATSSAPMTPATASAPMTPASPFAPMTPATPFLPATSFAPMISATSVIPGLQQTNYPWNLDTSPPSVISIFKHAIPHGKKTSLQQKLAIPTFFHSPNDQDDTVNSSATIPTLKKPLLSSLSKRPEKSASLKSQNFPLPPVPLPSSVRPVTPPSPMRPMTLPSPMRPVTSSSPELPCTPLSKQPFTSSPKRSSCPVRSSMSSPAKRLHAQPLQTQMEGMRPALEQATYPWNLDTSPSVCSLFKHAIPHRKKPSLEQKLAIPMFFHPPNDKDDTLNSSATPYSLSEYITDQQLPSQVQRTITPVVSTSPSREIASSSLTEDVEVLLSDESSQYDQEELSQGLSYDIEDINEPSEVQRTISPAETGLTSRDSIEDMEVHSQDDDKEHFSGALYQLLPFPCLPRKWYRNQGRLCQINAARTKVRQLNPVDTDDAGDRICLKRSQIGGSLEANIRSLANQIIDLKDKPSCSSKFTHLNAVHKVGE